MANFANKLQQSPTQTQTEVKPQQNSVQDSGLKQQTVADASKDLANKFSQFPNKFFFIFAPDYNKKINGKEIKVKVDNNEEITYKIINYSKIFDFFNEQQVIIGNIIPYYYEFLYAIEKHKGNTDNLHSAGPSWLPEASW